MNALLAYARRVSREGFTLVEVLIIILIVGVLAAVALPSFLGQSDKAKDADAKHTVSVSYRVAKALWRDQQAYPTDISRLLAELRRSEPEYTFKQFHPAGSRSTGPKDVTVSVEDDQMVTLCTYSEARRYFCARQDETGSLDLAARPAGRRDTAGGLLAFLTAPVAEAAQRTKGLVYRKGLAEDSHGDEYVLRCQVLPDRGSAVRSCPGGGGPGTENLPPLPPEDGGTGPSTDDPHPTPEDAPRLQWDTGRSLAGTAPGRVTNSNTGPLYWTQDGEDIYSVQCRRDIKTYQGVWTAGTWQDCTPGETHFSNVTRDADYAVALRACNPRDCTYLGDAAMGDDPQASGAYALHVNPLPPTLTIANSPGGTTDKAISGSLTIATSGKVTRQQCSVDGGAWTNCPGSSRSYSFDGGWTDNSHTVRIVAGNEGGDSPIRTLNLSFDETGYYSCNWPMSWQNGYNSSCGRNEDHGSWVQSDYQTGHYHCYTSNSGRWNATDDPLNASQFWGDPPRNHSGEEYWRRCYRTGPYAWHPYGADPHDNDHPWWHYGSGGDHSTPRMVWSASWRWVDHSGSYKAWNNRGSWSFSTS